MVLRVDGLISVTTTDEAENELWRRWSDERVEQNEAEPQLRHSSFYKPSVASPRSEALHLLHLANRPWSIFCVVIHRYGGKQVERWQTNWNIIDWINLFERVIEKCVVLTVSRREWWMHCNPILILSQYFERRDIMFCEFSDTILEQLQNQLTNLYEIFPRYRVLKIKFTTFRGW